MSKIEPDPSPILKQNSKLLCHTVFSALDWQNCEFDLESDIQKISDLFANTMLVDIQKNFEYSLLLTQDKEIQDLNNEYRNKNKPTDVLSFPQFHLSSANLDELKQAIEQAEVLSGDFADCADSEMKDVSRETSSAVMLGDIAVSWETFQKDLISLGLSARDHFAHLLVHSLLHLIGYDHEDDLDAKVMIEQEIKILSYLNIENPYKLQE